MLGTSVAIKSPAEFYQALNLSPKGDLVVTTRQLLRISSLANLLDKPTLLRVQPVKDPIIDDISTGADGTDLWKLIMLPNGSHATNPFRSSKSRRKDKYFTEPARFVQSVSTALVGPHRRCYLLSLQSDGRVFLYMMNGERPLVDFGALLVEKYFKNHAKQDKVDLNDYLNTMELITATTIACSPVISSNSEDSFLVVLGTRAGEIHIWKVTEQPSEDVPKVDFVAEAVHGDWLTAADWTLVKQELFLATGAADGSVKLWKIDGKKPTAVTAVKEINESDMYSVQALAWDPKQKGILAMAKSTLLELFDLNGKLPQEPIVVHAKPITQIAWRSCGEIIFTTGLDSVIKSWTYLPRNNTTAADAEVMEVDTESVRQLSHLNTLEFIPQQWGVVGMALSPNGIVAPILTFKPAETVTSSMFSNRSAAASLSLVETNVTSLEETVDFIISQPPPTTYWDLILVLNNKETQICLDLLQHTEERYITNSSDENTRIKACKLAYVLYRWAKSKLASGDEQLTHVNTRIAQLTQQIMQHHAEQAVKSFLAKKRAPSTREAASLTRLRNFLEPAQRTNIDKVLQSVKHATALLCPFCQAQIAGDDHCSRNPAHPLQFCAQTMIMIDTIHTLKCATCHQEALVLRDEKDNNFDWIAEPDLCSACNSLLANTAAI